MSKVGPDRSAAGRRVESRRGAPLLWVLPVLLVATACPGPEATLADSSADRANSPAGPVEGDAGEPQPHPSDGIGTLSLEGPAEVPAGSVQAFRLTYTSAEPGIDQGGGVLLQVSPFFGWSPPQSMADGRAGHTSIETSSKARLELEIGELHYAIARVVEGRLEPDDTITFTYGPARVDPFADRAERFYAKVDGNGDGFFMPLTEYPTVRITAGPPISLHAVLSSFADDEGRMALSVSVLDGAENRVEDYAGTVYLQAPPHVKGLPESYTFREEDRGAHRFELTVGDGDPFRVAIQTEDSRMEADSNRGDPSRHPSAEHVLLWGDLHGHSSLSDGSGTARDYYRYARDVSALDVAALTDHDAHGLWALDERPDLWELIRNTSAEFYEAPPVRHVLGL